MAEMVTTPVPPTPVTSMVKGRASDGCFGSGTLASWLETPVSVVFLAARRTLAPCTVTKLGQKPLTQEKSLLHADWSIARLVPSSVSSGATATQLDFTPQSPQPSHTAGLMNTRLSGSGNMPRLRRRRFSAAQVWSYSSTDTPLT